MKQCSNKSCQQVKPLSEFYTLKKTGKPDSWCKICRREYQKRYKEYKRLYQAAYGRTHLEEHKRWIAQNVEHLRLRSRARYYKNPAAFKAQARKRKLRLRGMAVRHTEQDWLSLLEAYEYRCFGCGVQSDKLTRDHIVPISKGGGDEIENIAPLCSSCNSKKGVHGPEWYMQKWLLELQND